MKSYSIFLLLFVEYVAQQTFTIHGSNISGNNFYGGQSQPVSTSTAMPYYGRQYTTTTATTRKTRIDGDGDQHTINISGNNSGQFRYSYVKHQNNYYGRKRDVGEPENLETSEERNVRVGNILRLPPLPEEPSRPPSNRPRPPFVPNPSATSSEEFRRRTVWMNEEV